MRNDFQGRCKYCGEIVLAGHGRIERSARIGWLFSHSECAVVYENNPRRVEPYPRATEAMALAMRDGARLLNFYRTGGVVGSAPDTRLADTVGRMAAEHGFTVADIIAKRRTGPLSTLRQKIYVRLSSDGFPVDVIANQLKRDRDTIHRCIKANSIADDARRTNRVSRGGREQ